MEPSSISIPIGVGILNCQQCFNKTTSQNDLIENNIVSHLHFFKISGGTHMYTCSLSGRYTPVLFAKWMINVKNSK